MICSFQPSRGQLDSWKRWPLNVKWGRLCIATSAVATSSSENIKSNVAMPSGPGRTSTKSRHFHAWSGMKISRAWNSKVSHDIQTHSARNQIKCHKQDKTNIHKLYSIYSLIVKGEKIDTLVLSRNIQNKPNGSLLFSVCCVVKPKRYLPYNWLKICDFCKYEMVTSICWSVVSNIRNYSTEKEICHNETGKRYFWVLSRCV